MTRPGINNPPEVESADHGAPSGTCAAGLGGVPAAPCVTPLAARRTTDRSAEDRPWSRMWRRSLYWAGEIAAGISIFVMLYILLLFGSVLQ